MEILNKVIIIISQIMGLKSEDIKPESTLIELGIDELDSIDIIMECENLFNITILDEDVDKFIAVGDLVAYIYAKKNSKESGEESGN